MAAAPIAIRSTGLVTSVGLSAPAACAAMRCKLTNPFETHFIDSAGTRIVGHSVPLGKPWRGLAKLTKMAALAIDECLAEGAVVDRRDIPLLLCVAELERPGRLEGLDDQLAVDIASELKLRFAPTSRVIAQGRVGVAVALGHARRLIHEQAAPRVVIAATDSLLLWPTLSAYERADRLLTGQNANGFIPGEGAGALLIEAPSSGDQLLCTGLGFGVEKAHIDSGEPLRADGLVAALKSALSDGGHEMHDLDFRITDVAGEQYYFKEAALALSRTLRQRKHESELWHPAECTGEAGALVGISMIALADAACRKGFAPGPQVVAHLANDAGRRAAMTLRFRAGS
jgi:3-oxoacyl-[acyl-carrier-protein] synthase I